MFSVTKGLSRIPLGFSQRCVRPFSSAFSTATTSDGKKRHQLNINKALKKKDEEHYFQDLIDQPVTTLQGVGPKHAEELGELGLSTIGKLADYKFYHLARSLVTLATVEEPGGRSTASTMNVNKGLCKEFETLAFSEIIEQPVQILQGISPAKSEVLASLGVETVKDLSEFKFCKWSEAIKTASNYEEKEIE